MFYPSLVVAILAAVVASQTMITATFQVNQSYWRFQRFDFNGLPAPVSNHQIILLPPNQGHPYLDQIPQSDLHPMGELATDGRDYLCDRRL